MTAAPNRYLEEQSTGMGRLDRMVRWYWIRRTGADPVVVLNHLRDMEALNSLHEKFLDRLGAKYPKLEQEIREHRSQCFDALNPPNIPDNTQ